MKKIVYGLLLTSFFISAQEAEISANATSLDNEVHDQIPQHHVYDMRDVQTGRVYYDSLVKKASKRHIAFPISASFTFDNSGFDSNGVKSTLAKTVFGADPITVRSIYLFSRLSDDNKVRINNTDAKACERGAIPIGKSGVPYGGFRDDLYTTLLAPVALSFDASQRQFMIVPSIIFHMDLGARDIWAAALGITIPFKNVQNEMELTFQNGDLFREGFLPQKTLRETSLDQFYRDYSDVEDFLNSAVFGPQGLTFDPHQSKTGFGDFSLFGMVEWHGKPDIDFGVSLVCPTGGKDSGETVWQPVLGNGGAFQIDPFIQALFSSASPYLNPFIRLAVEYSFPFTSDAIRVPHLVVNPVRQFARNVPGLLEPTFFSTFYVDPFEAYDSEIPAFAGRAKLREHMGTKLLLGVGNYAYELFHTNLRFGFFYDFMYKAHDSFSQSCNTGCPPPDMSCAAAGPCAACGTSCPTAGACTSCTSMITTTTTTSAALNIDSIAKNSNQISHTLSANLVYKFRNLCEIAIGGQCVARGKNVPQYRSIYFSVVALF